MQVCVCVSFGPVPRNENAYDAICFIERVYYFQASKEVSIALLFSRPRAMFPGIFLFFSIVTNLYDHFRSTTTHT